MIADQEISTSASPSLSRTGNERALTEEWVMQSGPVSQPQFHFTQGTESRNPMDDVHDMNNHLNADDTRSASHQSSSKLAPIRGEFPGADVDADADSADEDEKWRALEQTAYPASGLAGLVGLMLGLYEDQRRLEHDKIQKRGHVHGEVARSHQMPVKLHAASTHSHNHLPPVRHIAHHERHRGLSRKAGRSVAASMANSPSIQSSRPSSPGSSDTEYFYDEEED